MIYRDKRWRDDVVGAEVKNDENKYWRDEGELPEWIGITVDSSTDGVF